MPRFKGIATSTAHLIDFEEIVELLPRFKGIATGFPFAFLLSWCKVELLPRFKGIATIVSIAEMTN